MSLSVQQKSEYSLPEVFKNQYFEYTGSYEEKKKQIYIDILIWQASCISGQRPILKEFERAMKTMGDTLEHKDFMKILELTDEKWQIKSINNFNQEM